MQTPRKQGISNQRKLASEHVPSNAGISTPRDSKLFDVVFVQNPMGLILSYRRDLNVATVSGFETLGASLEGQVRIGDELVAANNAPLEGIGSDAVLSTIKSSSWPIRLRLRRRSPRQSPTASKPSCSIQFEDLQANNSKIVHFSREVDRLTDEFKCDVVHKRETADVAFSGFDQLPDLLTTISSITDRLGPVMARLERLERIALTTRGSKDD